MISITFFLISFIGYSVSQNIIYDINTQPICKYIERSRRDDCRWVAGLDMADLVIEGGRIAAYQIKWFSGKWSEWYVPGVNDLSPVYNAGARSCALPYRKNSMRRRWAVFYDHTHRFILCKPRN